MSLKFCLLFHHSFNRSRYETFFFRYISYIDDEAEYSNWVTYTATKQFAVYEGVFPGVQVEYNKSFLAMQDLDTHCNGRGGNFEEKWLEKK